MAGLERDQLESLKRQIEEEYRLDIAAIERLQRRFAGQNGSRGVSPLATPSALSAAETLANMAPALEPVPAAAQDDLTSSLRTMFSSVRK